MANESIIFSLGTNNRAVATGLAEAKGMVRNFKGEVAGMITGLFAGVGIEALISDFARVQDLADQLGVTAEEVQRVRGAADTAGTSIEFVAKQMTKAAAEARKVADGVQQVDVAGEGAGRTAKAFAALGINAREFANMAMEERLLAIAQGMDGIPDQGAKIAAAIDLFGARGKEMIPMLIQGFDSLKEELEGTSVVSNEMIAQIAMFDDQIARTGNTIKVFIVNMLSSAMAKVQDFGSYLGALAHLATRTFDGIGQGFDRLKNGDFKGVGAAFMKEFNAGVDETKEAYLTETLGREYARQKAGEDAVAKAELRKALAKIPDDEATAAKSKRIPLEERLAEIAEESARKQLSLQEQILALKNKQAEAEDASRASGLGEDDRKRYEDEAVEAAKQVAQLEAQSRAEEDKAKQAAQAKEERIIALRRQLHDQELEGLDKQDQNAALLKDLQDLASRNVQDEEQKLKLQLEANEIAKRMQFASASSSIGGNDDMLARAGGMRGQLYEGPMNLEAQKQTSMQQQMVDLLAKIEAKPLLPEAGF